MGRHWLWRALVAVLVTGLVQAALLVMLSGLSFGGLELRFLRRCLNVIVGPWVFLLVYKTAPVLAGRPIQWRVQRVGPGPAWLASGGWKWLFLILAQLLMVTTETVEAVRRWQQGDGGPFSVWMAELRPDSDSDIQEILLDAARSPLLPAAGGASSLAFVLLAICLFCRDWRDDRDLPMVCRCCGYNLTGNVSGVCPECGETLPPQAASAPPLENVKDDRP